MSNNKDGEIKGAESVQSQKNGEKNWSLFHWVFFIIAIVFTLTIAYLIVEPLFTKNTEEKEIKVSVIIPRDSLLAKNVFKENEKQLNSLIEQINNHNQAIVDKYELLIKSKERESDIYRFISVIVAFIVALLGFLGYRTIKDLEERVRFSASSKAEEIAKSITEDKMSSTVESKLNTRIANSVFANLIREQIMKEINKDISSPLSARIDRLSERLSAVERDKNKVSQDEAIQENEKEENQRQIESRGKDGPSFSVPGEDETEVVDKEDEEMEEDEEGKKGGEK